MAEKGVLPQTRVSKSVSTALQKLIREGQKAPIPSVAPMLCTLTKTPIDDPDYLYEIKWDGYRIISHVHKNKVRMESRSALDYTSRYPVAVSALRELSHDIVIDGEVVVFNAEGTPDFNALQLYNGHATDISYCVKDALVDNYFPYFYFTLKFIK